MSIYKFGVTVVFRVDASVEIGSGHVMRCLTIAEALKTNGVQCHFVCREHPGNMIELVRSRGFNVHALPATIVERAENTKPKSVVPHASWLGASIEEDALLCADLISHLLPDWLVADHYSLDSAWINNTVFGKTKTLILDDLADRLHNADILLDQSLGRLEKEYNGLISSNCKLLVGSAYAILRPEFKKMRSYSLERRKGQEKIRSLLVNLGGVDKDNVTSKVLKAIGLSDLPLNCRITIVMGATAPWIPEVRKAAQSLPYETEVVVNVNDMANRMCNADLAIGAAGSTSWERCCLGLPTLMLVLAANQKNIAEKLEAASASYTVDHMNLNSSLPIALSKISKPNVLSRMSDAASKLVDGRGVDRLLNEMSSLDYRYVK